MMNDSAMNSCADNAVTGRFDELHDDMEGGFSKLRKNLEKMSADELRRDVSSLMMIGHSQMNTIRSQNREIDRMQRDLLSLNGERARMISATMDLLGAMGIAYDVEDDCPAKWIRMAASVARERRCEPFEMELPADRGEGRVEAVTTVALSVFALCMVVWTVLMVSAWL